MYKLLWLYMGTSLVSSSHSRVGLPCAPSLLPPPPPPAPPAAATSLVCLHLFWTPFHHCHNHRHRHCRHPPAVAHLPPPPAAIADIAAL